MIWNPPLTMLARGLVFVLVAACGSDGTRTGQGVAGSEDLAADGSTEQRPAGEPSEETGDAQPDRLDPRATDEEPSDGEIVDPTPEEEPTEEAPVELLPPDAEIPIGGLYATEWRMVATYEVPNPFGDSMMSGEGETLVLGMARIEQEGDGWTIEEWGCGGSSDIDLMGGVQITIPSALPLSVPSSRSALHVQAEEDGWTWRREEVATAVGVRMGDPTADPLPDDRHDDRIWDQDADGHPGVTVGVENPLLAGDIYVAQRQRNTLYGGVAADGSLFGVIEDSAEQKVLDSDNILLRMDIVMHPPESLDRNTVSMVPVEPGTDCAWLLDKADEVFE